MSIFFTEAPKYWAVGLQAIPLRVEAKVPIPQKWQTYSTEPISNESKADWLHRLSTSNIGVVGGAASGVVFLDNDTTDARVAGMLDSILPPSPWTRIGQKGFVRAYRYDPMNASSWQIKDENGKVVMELLANLRQAVMPPSIHPDTKLPYKADGNLYDPQVMSGLVVLPPGLKDMMIAALNELGIKASAKDRVNVSSPVVMGGRDVAMVRIAGHYANCVLKGEASFVDVRDQMLGWFDARVEKVEGDELDIVKGLGKIAEFLIRDVVGKGKSLPEGWDHGLSDEERELFGFGVFGDDHRRWTYTEIKEWLHTEMMIHEPDSEGARMTLQGVLKRVIRSDCNEATTDQLLHHARAVTGMKNVRLAVLRKSLGEMTRSGIKGDSHREIAEAVMKELNSLTLHRYWGTEFWSWSGSHWEIYGKSELTTYIGKNFGDLPMCKRQSDHAAIVRYMSDAMMVKSLNSANVEGINFKNGFMMAVAGKGLIMKPHDESYGANYELDYRYDLDVAGKFPRFAKFLVDCWGEDEDYEDKVACLRQAMAVTMLGKGPAFQRAVCLHGVPSTGKSVLLRIVQKLLPSSVQCAIPPDRWQERFDTSGFVGKLLNICGELDEKKAINGKAFKGIICGELMQVERKNRDGFDYSPVATHWFASNHLPKSEDGSEGFARRWLFLNFKKIVQRDDVVRDLADVIITEEGEAIVAWVAGVADTIARENFQSDWVLPSTHHMLMRELQVLNNNVLQFVRDSGRVLVAKALSAAQEPIGEDTLYNAYSIYVYEAGGVRPVRLNIFKQRMRELGSAMGFELKERLSESGASYCEYTNLTLAKIGMGNSRK